jgi:guanylate kinase
LSFSISACTRKPRPGEKHGKDYYFLEEEDFRRKIDENAFLEWEMVYTGKYYGTLNAELERIWQTGKAPLVDIDVKGALNIKSQFGNRALSLFIKAPSTESLRRRLLSRGTESSESLQERLDKAAEELTYEPKFDFVVINDDLETAVAETLQIIDHFLNDK